MLQGDGFRFIGGDGIACLDALNRRAGCVGGLSGFLRGLLGLCDFLRLGGGLSVRCGAGVRTDAVRVSASKIDMFFLFILRFSFMMF